LLGSAQTCPATNWFRHREGYCQFCLCEHRHQLEPEPAQEVLREHLGTSLTTATLADVYVLDEALAFAEHFEDPARVLAWILGKCDRSRSERCACEIPEWDTELVHADEEADGRWLHPKYVLHA
jgi:hypothetical protein